MATTALTAGLMHGGSIIDKSPITPRSKRKLQKHLRSSGLAYISRTGKLIPAKKVADELCQCPQKCDERVPMELRERLFAHFYGMGDTDLQNAFLREHMDVRARYHFPHMDIQDSNATTTTAASNNNNNNNNNRSPRRITCKYLVPKLPSTYREDDAITETVDVCQKAFVSAFVITTKRVRLQREKLISSLGLNSYGHTRKNAENNNAAIVGGGGGVGGGNNNNNRATKALKNVIRLDDSGDEDDVDEDNNNSTPIPVKRKNAESKARTTESGAKKGGRGNQAANKRRRFVDDPLIPFGLMMPDSVTIAPVTASADHVRDIAIVNNFFSNQLWKPEYIQGGHTTTYS